MKGPPFFCLEHVHICNPSKNPTAHIRPSKAQKRKLFTLVNMDMCLPRILKGTSQHGYVFTLYSMLHPIIEGEGGRNFVYEPDDSMQLQPSECHTHQASHREV